MRGLSCVRGLSNSCEWSWVGKLLSCSRRISSKRGIPFVPALSIERGLSHSFMLSCMGVLVSCTRKMSSKRRISWLSSARVTSSSCSHGLFFSHELSSSRGISRPREPSCVFKKSLLSCISIASPFSLSRLLLSCIFSRSFSLLSPSFLHFLNRPPKNFFFFTSTFSSSWSSWLTAVASRAKCSW